MTAVKLAVFALLSLGVSSLTVTAHSWYDFACCAENDCHPIPESEVRVTPEGHQVRGQLIPYGQERRSGDSEYHICMPNPPTIKCLYAPPRGT